MRLWCDISMRNKDKKRRRRNLPMSYTQMACECGSGCDDGAVSRLLNITVQVEERDTSIITCFCRHITIRYNQQLSRWASGWMTPDQTSFYAYLIFMHITSSTMIRRQETIHCESETRKFLMHWKGIKWRRWCGKTSNKMESSQRKESGGIVKEGCSSRSSEEYYAAAA